ncbi:c-type cytochrome [Roseibium sp.]|uniref:c-type cytochrome n=1 Tax=Roseibium sp. TaxID=1936156 RepID=UPI003A983315
MLRHAFIVLGGVFLAQGALAEAPQGDPASGKAKAGMCRTCHGLDGFAKIPIAPHIGGEPAPYLVHQLTAFREGTRTHEMMSVVAKGLDDQAIADLAAWYSSQRASAALPAGKEADMAPEACVACHGADGLSELEDAPNLAGETVMYIDTQLKAFRTGKRVHEIMSEVAAQLSDEEIRAVSEWYSGVKLKIEQAN